jgi:hypothetical protein
VLDNHPAEPADGDLDAVVVAAAPAVRRDVELLAAAWNVSLGEVVGRLVDHYHRTRRPVPLDPEWPTDTDVAIHCIYRGVRVDGYYHRLTRSVTVTSDPLPGHHFASASGARAGVVSALNPGVAPNGSGWGFWIVTATGKRLRSIRHT